LADDLPPLYGNVKKSGALNYPEPLGPPRPVAGDLYFNFLSLLFLFFFLTSPLFFLFHLFSPHSLSVSTFLPHMPNFPTPSPSSPNLLLSHYPYFDRQKYILGRFHPFTGHEALRDSRGIALLYFRPLH